MMARPERQNADYFPFYAKDGRTLFLLESKYNCKGTGFFTNVMRFLTLETHHQVSLQDETDKMYFFSKCYCDEESGIDMLNIMAKTGKINKELWDKKVIASQDLLESLTDAYRNRKNNIITMPEIAEKYVSDVGNPVPYAGNPQEPGVSDVDKPQRKGKKRKEKNIKKERFTLPTLKEVEAYCKERKNNINPSAFMDSNIAKGWLVGKTKTPMKDWKAVIRTWEQNRKDSQEDADPGPQACRTCGTTKWASLNTRGQCEKCQKEEAPSFYEP